MYTYSYFNGILYQGTWSMMTSSSLQVNGGRGHFFLKMRLGYNYRRLHKKFHNDILRWLRENLFKKRRARLTAAPPPFHYFIFETSFYPKNKYSFNFYVLT